MNCGWQILAVSLLLAMMLAASRAINCRFSFSVACWRETRVALDNNAGDVDEALKPIRSLGRMYVTRTGVFGFFRLLHLF